MTLDEFFTELLKLKDQYRWKEWAAGVRGNCNYCYITAVYRKRTGVSMTEYRAKDCGWELGLSPTDIDSIITICDNPQHPLYTKYKELLCNDNTTVQETL